MHILFLLFSTSLFIKLQYVLSLFVGRKNEYNEQVETNTPREYIQ